MKYLPSCARIQVTPLNGVITFFFFWPILQPSLSNDSV